MPPKRLISVSPTDPLNLQCEWGTCTEVHTNMLDYMSHVTFIHLHERSRDENQTEAYRCEWKDCDSDLLGDFRSFVRHTYFHLFHIKLKSIGTNLMAKNNLMQCTLNSDCRNMIPELPDSFLCLWDECEETYDNPQLFYNHVNHHCDMADTQPGNVKCKWRDCGIQKKNRYKLKEHMRVHTQEKALSCPTCGSLFSAPVKLLDHIERQIESDVQNFQCSHCDKKFASERILRDHMRQHVNSKSCPHCEMTMPSPAAMKNHILYRHSDERPFSCNKCNYHAKTIKDLKMHENRHENKCLECWDEDCNYITLNASDLISHFQRKHAGGNVSPYACHLCYMRYHRGSKLTTHLKKAHNYQWPPGHRKFKYKLCPDGLYRLQTVRYESVELTEQKKRAEEEKERKLAEENGGANTSKDLQYNLDLLVSAALKVSTNEAPTNKALSTLEEEPVQASDTQNPEVEDNQKQHAEINQNQEPQINQNLTRTCASRKRNLSEIAESSIEVTGSFEDTSGNPKTSMEESPTKKNRSRKSAPRKRAKNVEVNETKTGRCEVVLSNGQTIIVESNVPFAGAANHVPEGCTDICMDEAVEDGATQGVHNVFSIPECSDSQYEENFANLLPVPVCEVNEFVSSTPKTVAKKSKRPPRKSTRRKPKKNAKNTSIEKEKETGNADGDSHINDGNDSHIHDVPSASHFGETSQQVLSPVKGAGEKSATVTRFRVTNATCNETSQSVDFQEELKSLGIGYFH